MLLLGAVYLFFLTALWQAGADFFGLILFAALFLAAQYFFSDKLALFSMGAREVSPEEAPELHAMVERLCAMSDLPKPRVAVSQMDMPNAFAAGRAPSRSVVAVTKGLLERLDQPETEAVLAHELSHIGNRDVAVMTFASFLSTVAWFIVRYSYLGMGGRRNNPVVFVYLVSLLVYVASFFLLRALSRHRELAADRGSAVITGAPSHLASALVKISGAMQRIPERDLREVEGMNAFFIVPALRASSLWELIATHPSLERRLEQLRQMEQKMEAAL